MVTSGYSTIFRLLQEGTENIYVAGFTLSEKETRRTVIPLRLYKKPKYDNGDRLIDHVHGRGNCHSFSKERDILAWLHNNEKIDASLCMLKDTEEYTLEDNKYNTLPSQYIINLLNGEQHEKKE